jgi:hypothetical protein
LKGHNAEPTCYDRLQEVLKVVIPNGTFNQWLGSKSKLLDGQKPLDLILDGKCDQVMAAALEIEKRGYR